MTKTLDTTTALTPSHYERKKTTQQKAEDVIYTLNHAVTCLSITDVFGIGLAAQAVEKITGKVPFFAEEEAKGYGPIDWIKDRFKGTHKRSDYVRPAPTPPEPGMKAEFELFADSGAGEMMKKMWHNARGWLISEAIGDLGAVPFTVGVQRLFPGFMDDLRRHIEPVIGKAFRKNTHRAAENWGKKHGMDANSQEVADYAHQLYEYEMRHMPQMAVWTVASVGLNFAAMKALHLASPENFKPVTTGEFIAGKSIGAAMTAGLMLSIRGLTPGGAHKWDETIGKKVIVPITKGVGGVFGVKSEDVDQFQKHRLNDAPLEAKGVKMNPTTTVSEAEIGGRAAEPNRAAAISA